MAPLYLPSYGYSELTQPCRNGWGVMGMVGVHFPGLPRAAVVLEEVLILLLKTICFC